MSKPIVVKVRRPDTYVTTEETYTYEQLMGGLQGETNVVPQLVQRCKDYESQLDEKNLQLIQAKQELFKLMDQLPTVVKIAVEHTHNGHNPGIYLRGNVWRYHLDLMCNQRSDNPDPVKAAQGEHVEQKD
jgi:hypothetical protein